METKQTSRVRFPVNEKEPETGVLFYHGMERPWFGGFVSVLEDGSIIPVSFSSYRTNFFLTRDEAMNFVSKLRERV